MSGSLAQDISVTSGDPTTVKTTLRSAIETNKKQRSDFAAVSREPIVLTVDEATKVLKAIATHKVLTTEAKTELCRLYLGGYKVHWAISMRVIPSLGLPELIFDELKRQFYVDPGEGACDPIAIADYAKAVSAYFELLTPDQFLIKLNELLLHKIYDNIYDRNKRTRAKHSDSTDIYEALPRTDFDKSFTRASHEEILPLAPQLIAETLLSNLAKELKSAPADINTLAKLKYTLFILTKFYDDPTGLLHFSIIRSLDLIEYYSPSEETPMYPLLPATEGTTIKDHKSYYTSPSYYSRYSRCVVDSRNPLIEGTSLISEKASSPLAYFYPEILLKLFRELPTSASRKVALEKLKLGYEHVTQQYLLRLAETLKKLRFTAAQQIEIAQYILINRAGWQSGEFVTALFESLIESEATQADIAEILKIEQLQITEIAPLLGNETLLTHTDFVLALFEHIKDNPKAKRVLLTNLCLSDEIHVLLALCKAHLKTGLSSEIRSIAAHALKQSESLMAHTQLLRELRAVKGYATPELDTLHTPDAAEIKKDDHLSHLSLMASCALGEFESVSNQPASDPRLPYMKAGELIRKVHEKGSLAAVFDEANPEAKGKSESGEMLEAIRKRQGALDTGVTGKTVDNSRTASTPSVIDILHNHLTKLWNSANYKTTRFTWIAKMLGFTEAELETVAQKKALEAVVKKSIGLVQLHQNAINTGIENPLPTAPPALRAPDQRPMAGAGMEPEDSPMAGAGMGPENDAPEEPVSSAAGQPSAPPVAASAESPSLPFWGGASEAAVVAVVAETDVSESESDTDESNQQPEEAPTTPPAKATRESLAEENDALRAELAELRTRLARSEADNVRLRKQRSAQQEQISTVLRNLHELAADAGDRTPSPTR